MPEPLLQPTAKPIWRAPKTNVYIHLRLPIARSFSFSFCVDPLGCGDAPAANELAKHAAVRLLSAPDRPTLRRLAALKLSTGRPN